MLRFRLKACAKCGGDLALDEGDWICLQCGTYYYVRLYPGAQLGGHAGPARQPAGESTAHWGDLPPLGPVGKGESWGFDQAVVAGALAAALWAPRPATT